MGEEEVYKRLSSIIGKDIKKIYEKLNLLISEDWRYYNVYYISDKDKVGEVKDLLEILGFKVKIEIDKSGYYKLSYISNYDKGYKEWR